MRARRRMAVRGVVQGVGFRPFVYRLANELCLSGFVRNDGDGATLELEGATRDLESFETRLVAEVPEGGRVDGVDRTDLTPLVKEKRFVIEASRSDVSRQMSLVPDRAVCAACLEELFDPDDRRAFYPFINCTHCGPRYTITQSLPYDRRNTTMDRFDMCPACRREFEDPLDRRYHAQPTACPVCGPSVWLERDNERKTGDPIDAAVDLLKAEKVVAVKGIGGFHLAVDATDPSAVARLRTLKRRPRKPLALMVRDLETARRIVHLDDETEALLTSPTAPIVLAPAKEDAALAAWIAEGVGDLGVMLPYSPLHHLLFRDGLSILVMTSGNPPSEPITTDNGDAVARLDADAFLMHDRDIQVANDDSVVRTTAHGPAMVRRSRGFVPDALDGSMLPECSTLALGALLKVTVSVLHQGQLIVGRHLGDLDNVRAEEAFEEEVERMLAFSRIEPEAVAVDQHPDIASLAFAEERFSGVPIVRVQHHHAHMAAVMAEHGLGPDDTVTGIVLDGFGHGLDGAVWGGEVLVGGYREFERAAHLRYVPQPGGDRAALEPRRMAISLLADAAPDSTIHYELWDDDIARVAGMRDVSPTTSSAGRLFDGAAAILGLAPGVQEFEGEAAMRLEAVVDPAVQDAYPLPLLDDTLDTRALIRALVEDSEPVPTRAARFINGLADGLVTSATAAGPDTVVLGGGCMVNRFLLARLVNGLEKNGAKALVPRKLPAGDGSVSAGQAACAAVMRFKESV